MFILKYIDDVMFIDFSTTQLQNFVDSLRKQFSIKDMDSLSYFLILKVTFIFDDHHMCQMKYVHKLLSHYGLFSLKPTLTLMASR